MQYIGMGIGQYIKNPIIDNVAPWRVEDYWKIQRYLPNESFSYLHLTMYKDGTNRLLAWMIRCN